MARRRRCLRDRPLPDPFLTTELLHEQQAGKNTIVWPPRCRPKCRQVGEGKPRWCPAGPLFCVWPSKPWVFTARLATCVAFSRFRAGIRRRYYRCRGARFGHGLLSGPQSRVSPYCRPGQELYRWGWLGTQHRHHPVELPHARRGPVLRAVRAALPFSRCGSQLQRDVRPARAPDPRPHRQFAPHHALAGRGQQARRR